MTQADEVRGVGGARRAHELLRTDFDLGGQDQGRAGDVVDRGVLGDGLQ
ncbi:hypothetical protein ACIA8H_32035 [Streptomyces goshikiensis]